MRHKAKKLIDGILFIVVGLQFLGLLWFSKVITTKEYRQSGQWYKDDHPFRTLTTYISDDFGLSINLQIYGLRILALAFVAWGIWTIKRKVLDGIFFIFTGIHFFVLQVISGLIVMESYARASGSGINECTLVSLQEVIEIGLGISTEFQTAMLMILAIIFITRGTQTIKRNRTRG